MGILDILSKMRYILKNIGSIEHYKNDFLKATLPNILQKEKMKSD